MPFGKWSKKQMSKWSSGKSKSRRAKVDAKDIGRAKKLSVVNNPLTKTLKAHMMYSTNVSTTLVSSVADPGTFVYSLNGCYAPEITGLANAHQPRGFDELMNLYDHFTVINAKARVDCHNNGGVTSALVVATVRDGVATSTNLADYLESKNSQWKLLGVESSGSADKQLMLNINPNEFLGRPKPLSDPELRGSNTTNPGEGCFLHVSACSMDFFTASSVSVVVTIDYTVILTEPKQPSIS